MNEMYPNVRIYLIFYCSNVIFHYQIARNFNLQQLPFFFIFVC